MLKGRTFSLTSKKTRLLILLFTIAVCVALIFYVGIIMGQEMVYTHFFYIPIILAGLWYRKKAIYTALFLSIVYILVTHLSTQVVTLRSFERCAILLAVAYIIGLISEKRAKAQEELEEERKKVGEVLRESEEKFRGIAERSFDVIRTMDREGCVTCHNAYLSFFIAHYLTNNPYLL